MTPAHPVTPVLWVSSLFQVVSEWSSFPAWKPCVCGGQNGKQGAGIPPHLLDHSEALLPPGFPIHLPLAFTSPSLWVADPEVQISNQTPCLHPTACLLNGSLFFLDKFCTGCTTESLASNRKGRLCFLNSWCPISVHVLFSPKCPSQTA